MSTNVCKKCNRPLNESQYRTSEGYEYKSCPKCSSNNGKEHVYYEFPEGFGETVKRASSSHPNGPQSYCVPCRGRGNSTSEYKLCSEL
ncbi:hypothetical protein [Clostridium amazonitimonense]|uniref:hypothetical protein n=1 Tax=Clostridium amazonitimonense TaxID=1499689 RepID=UPI0005A9D08E|nr:hypothetical protein [Clostridium amazonitimonense]